MHGAEFTMMEWYRVGVGAEGILLYTRGLLRAAAAALGLSVEEPTVLRHADALSTFSAYRGDDPIERARAWGMRLRAGDAVVGMDVVVDKSTFVIVSENGFGKKTMVDQFTPHKRGGVGIKAAITNSKTGKIVAVKSVSDDTGGLMVISEGGQVIRLSLEDVPKLSRSTQGVRIMRLNGDDRVASFEIVQDEIGEEAEMEIPQES